MSQEIRIILISILTGIVVGGWFLLTWFLVVLILREIRKK